MLHAKNNIETIDITGQLIINLKAREWCQLPYPGHPKGCPNYDKSPKCPPQAPVVTDHFNLTKQHWFVVVKFNLAEHMTRMKTKHPEWTEKQCRCCLYWQNTVRKQLRIGIQQLQSKYPNIVSTLLPEAMGVNVMVTARKLGIPIEVKPTEFVHKIALVGYPKNNKQKYTGDYTWK